MVKKINAEQFNEVAASGVAVVDFSAVWCGPCKMLAPVLEQVSDEMDGKVSFFNVDVDENSELAEAQGITNIPALLILKDGVKQELQVGFQPKENLIKILEQYI